ncbi:hypothetical protein [Nodularia chucula]|uniref:hypothetical protein n=1 Tax=Nodularia chucula TaxID=3093667 RepID=UPI0039C72746
MDEWKIIASLPNKIVTQQDLRRKGSWIPPLLMLLPGLVPIWLGIPILPQTIACQPLGLTLLHCEKKQAFLGIPIHSESYNQTTSKPQSTTKVIPGNTLLVSIGVAWIGGLGSILFLSAWLTVTLTTCSIEQATNQISICTKTALGQRVATYLISEVQELMLTLPSSASVAIESSFADLVKIKLKTPSGKFVLLYYQTYDQLTQIDDLLVSLSQLLNLPENLVLTDWGLDVWKFESNGKITTHRLGKCLGEYTFKDIATVETETMEEDHAKRTYCYRVNLVTINGKRLPVAQFLSEELNVNKTTCAEIRANLVSDRLRQFMNFPVVQ